jgi:hypothetical protein
MPTKLVAQIARSRALVRPAFTEPPRRRCRVPALAFAQMRAPDCRSAARLLRTSCERQPARDQGLWRSRIRGKAGAETLSAPIHATEHSAAGRPQKRAQESRSSSDAALARSGTVHRCVCLGAAARLGR